MQAQANRLENAVCALHPERPAVGTCARCGAFLCADDRNVLDDKSYCPTCFALPEVNYLEAYRKKCAQTRDGWTWLVGLSGVRTVATGAFGLMAGPQLVISAFFLAAGCIEIAFWLKQRWARTGLLAATVVVAVLLVSVASGPKALILGLLSILIIIFVLRDTRNKLTFGLPVSDKALRKSWRLYHDNVIARYGFALSLLGLIVPTLEVVGLICSVVGLRRVNPQAHPPIGRKGLAIAGVVLGTLGTVIHVLLIFAVPLLLRSRSS